MILTACVPPILQLCTCSEGCHSAACAHQSSSICYDINPSVHHQSTKDSASQPIYHATYYQANNLSIVQAGDLQKACAIAREDPSSDLVPTQADFQERVQSLAAQLLQVSCPSLGGTHLVMSPADAMLCFPCLGESDSLANLLVSVRSSCATSCEARA